MGKRLPRPAVLQRFGRLRVVIPEGRYKGGRAALFICDCGRLKAAPIHLLYRKSCPLRSCGCWKGTKHGLSKDSGRHYITKALNGIQQRCENPKDKSYVNYGGRGIECRFKDAVHLLSVVGERPTPQHSIDRIDNNGHYEPGNVRWASLQEQHRNTRRNLVPDGFDICMAELAENHSIPYETLRQRYLRGDRGERLLRPVAPTTRIVNYDGVEMSVAAAARFAGLRQGTVHRRIQLGWPESKWFEPIG